MIEPRRGDIFYVNKGYTTGSEQDAGRPAVIVSNDTGNEHAPVVMVVYLTTQPKSPMPTHCGVYARVPSTALCEQICTVSKDRLGEYIRSCDNEEMDRIDKALMIALGIEENGDDEELPWPVKEEREKLAEDERMKMYKLEVERDLYKGYFEKLVGIA